MRPRIHPILAWVRVRRRVPIPAAVLVGGLGLVWPAGGAGADGPGVLTVTDVTEAGRTLSPPSRERPMYYQAVSVGFQSFGRAIAGDREPANDELLQVVLRTLRDQGYEPSTEQNPPTLVLGFAWGYLSGNFGGALRYLGGDKLDLMWETQHFGGNLDPRVLTRGLRSPLQRRVVEMANEPLYVVTIVAYDRENAIRGELTELWTTRIACPARGFWAKDALSQIVRAAGPSIGRETELPEWLSPAEARRRASVEIGDLETVDLTPLDSLPLPGSPAEKASSDP